MHLAFEEGRIVLPHGILNRVVLRIKSLNKHAAWELPASGASRHLCQKLKGTLGGAKIRETQRRVRADDSYQRYSLEVVALRQHLCSHQNIQGTAGKCTKHLLVLPFCSRCVAIQSRDARARKFPSQSFFDLLRAFAKKIDIF